MKDVISHEVFPIVTWPCAGLCLLKYRTYTKLQQSLCFMAGGVPHFPALHTFPSAAPSASGGLTTKTRPLERFAIFVYAACDFNVENNITWIRMRM